MNDAASQHSPPEPPQDAEPRGRRPLGRRVGLWALLLLGGLVALLLVALLGGMLYLQTGGGQRHAAELVVSKVKESLRGELALRGLRVSGFLNICVEGVDLRDPEGRPVLRADRVCAHVDPVALRAKRVVLSRVTLERPWVESATILGDAPGTTTTTLKRAVEARHPSAPQATGSTWVIQVVDLHLRGGTVRILPEPGASPSAAVSGLALAVRDTEFGPKRTSAALQLQAALEAPVRTTVALDLDGGVDGALQSGKAALRKLALRFGQSSLQAAGNGDLTAHTGELRIDQLRLLPADVNPLLATLAAAASALPAGEPVPPPLRLLLPLQASGSLRADGQKAKLDLDLDAGAAGKLTLLGTSTFEAKPAWAAELKAQGIDPGAIVEGQLRGTITAQVSANGRGAPHMGKEGPSGDFRLQAHLGPARLEGLGPLVADLEARLDGPNALVRAFSAAGLGLQIKAHGAAAGRELSLDVDVDAPRLVDVARAIGALRHQPPPLLSGSARISARLTGSARRPDAELRIHAPTLRFGAGLRATDLRVVGLLAGDPLEPDGTLDLSAASLTIGKIPWSRPRVHTELEWPLAHLRVDAGVTGGALAVVGDATIDEDRDGLVLSGLTITYPGNELKLTQNVALHFRPDETILEPLELRSEHGSIRLAAENRPADAKGKGGKLDATVVVSRLDLAHLPAFVLPPGTGLHGMLDASAVAKGSTKALELDLNADVQQAGAARLGAVGVAGHTHAHLHANRLRAEGTMRTTTGVQLDLRADLPTGPIARDPAATPVEGQILLRGVDLAQLVPLLHKPALDAQRLRGEVELRVQAAGTLAEPRVVVSLEGRKLGVKDLDDLELRSGLLIDEGRAVVDANLNLRGRSLVGLEAQAAFDLQSALRQPGYLAGYVHRALSARLVVPDLDLKQLAKGAVLPPDSAGHLSLTASLSGTIDKPHVLLLADGRELDAGKLRALRFQAEGALGSKTQLTVAVQEPQHALGKLQATAAISGSEVLALARSKRTPQDLQPLFNRPVDVTVDLPGLVVGRTPQTPRPQDQPARGHLEAKLSLTGTLDDPKLDALLRLRELYSRRKGPRIGDAEFTVKARADGATLHLDLSPPGGGTFKGDVHMQADLRARTLLAQGVAALRSAAISGKMAAQKLDLGFLSGLAPNLRRTQGQLDGAVAIAGTVGRPQVSGDADLRRGSFDIVGQGVYDDVSCKVRFSPRELLVERLAGSTDGGTFSAVLVGTRAAGAGAGGADRIDFTGEIHLGDPESVRDRADAKGRPLVAAPVPIRQAGEDRADVRGEVDLFGSAVGGAVDVTARIPDGRVRVVRLPDKKLPKLDPNPEILLVHPGERPHPPGREPEDMDREEKARRESTFKLHAHLDLQHLYVQADDFEFPLRSDLRFDYDGRDPDHPSADGEINAPNGSFTALGRRFQIDNAKITETGGEISNPDLEVKARFENSKATVIIGITGTAREPQVDLTSVPPMDQDAIAFFLATGRIEGRATQSGGGLDLSNAATSLVGGLLFGELRKSLAQVLPVDVVTIEKEQASVGKYIGDRIYIGYRQRLIPAPGENTSEGKIEYEISRQVDAEATVGEKNSDVAVLYTRDF